ncbi:MAG: hypothetical protein QM612_02400 [Thermomonas sp.]|uniref:hypothetical protein n=1 Tax=Thermomonas sp. TaxID=1971895 RepID=UPI0039E6BE4F
MACWVASADMQAAGAARKLMLLGLLAVMPAAHAGVFGDAFGKCLVNASNDQDRQQLMEWIFSAIALNPTIMPYANISPEQRSAIDQKMASLFERLVGEACQKEASEALKYEGASAFETAFQLFGQVAGQQLFASKEVLEGAQDFYKLLDAKALQEKLGIPADKP